MQPRSPTTRLDPLLERIFFDQDRAAATRTVLWAHSNGAAVCGTFPPDIATTKAGEVLEFARAHAYPLRCVTEAVARTRAVDAPGNCPRSRQALPLLTPLRTFQINARRSALADEGVAH